MLFIPAPALIPPATDMTTAGRRRPSLSQNRNEDGHSTNYSTTAGAIGAADLPDHRVGICIAQLSQDGGDSRLASIMFRHKPGATFDVTEMQPSPPCARKAKPERIVARQQPKFRSHRGPQARRTVSRKWA
jgi:hypothetical protein